MKKEDESSIDLVNFPKQKTSKKYTRFVLDPFQIFCLENRPLFVKRFPNKKIYEITSMLASVWRSLPESQKQNYHSMALQLKNNKCSVNRKTKGKEKEEKIDQNNEKIDESFTFDTFSEEKGTNSLISFDDGEGTIIGKDMMDYSFRIFADEKS